MSVLLLSFTSNEYVKTDKLLAYVCTYLPYHNRVALHWPHHDTPLRVLANDERDRAASDSTSAHLPSALRTCLFAAVAHPRL
jgi:hypothetical protein